MDYLVFAVLRQFRRGLEQVRVPVNIIYDIVCQYFKNIIRRMEKLPVDMKIPDDIQDFRYFIPKFHLPAHGSSCQSIYSLNWRENCGRTYGERTEHEWSHIKKCAAQTIEQGPGARHATLDDQWGGWNWERVLALGMFTLCLMVCY